MLFHQSQAAPARYCEGGRLSRADHRSAPESPLHAPCQGAKNCCNGCRAKYFSLLELAVEDGRKLAIQSLYS